MSFVSMFLVYKFDVVFTNPYNLKDTFIVCLFQCIDRERTTAFIGAKKFVLAKI